jgi:hypothetical protein
VTDGVVRVGDSVRRPAGTNSKLVSELLLLLERLGFNEAPRFLGYDDQGRETLTFIEGDVPSDCRASVWTDAQLAASVTLLRRFHDHTAGSDLAGGSEVICHNDYGPWNLVWRDEAPVAIIDFDNAAPGRRLNDLGYAAWKHLNLGLLGLPVAEQRRRLEVMTMSYGAAQDKQLLEAIAAAQATMRRLIEAAPAGTQRDIALAQIDGEQEWLDHHGVALIA